MPSFNYTINFLQPPTLFHPISLQDIPCGFIIAFLLCLPFELNFRSVRRLITQLFLCFMDSTHANYHRLLVLTLSLSDVPCRGCFEFHNYSSYDSCDCEVAVTRTSFLSKMNFNRSDSLQLSDVLEDPRFLSFLRKWETERNFRDKQALFASNFSWFCRTFIFC